MRINQIVVLFIGFFLIFCSFIQQTDDDKLYWKGNILDWSYFQGKADRNAPTDAISDCRITANMKTKKDSLIFVIESYLSKKGSWVKEGTQTQALLKHEQGHFDLNEIYARKFRKELLEYKFLISTSKTDFSKIQSKYFELLNKEQTLYDSETMHSNNNEKQIEWNKKIEKQLKELESYNRSKITVAYSKK